MAGWVSLPVCSGQKEAAREYVFGYFIDRAAGDPGARWSILRGEILREQIRAALAEFRSPCGGPPVLTRFVRGDSNLDGKLDLSDAVFILGALFTGSAKLRCEDAADVNDDGDVNISDPSALLNFLFLGGKLPPGTGAGKLQDDATTDKLGCEFYPKS